MSRANILNKIKSHKPAPCEYPQDTLDTITYADPIATFKKNLEAVGGSILEVKNIGEAHLAIAKSYNPCQKIWSESEGFESKNITKKNYLESKDFADIDLFITHASLGVSENGAIWIDESMLEVNRIILHLSQYVAVIIKKDSLVDTMHQAYKKLKRPIMPYGIFISGPSKTADIEQSLVIGAHGPRSLSVYLCD